MKRKWGRERERETNVSWTQISEIVSDEAKNESGRSSSRVSHLSAHILLLGIPLAFLSYF